MIIEVLYSVNMYIRFCVCKALSAKSCYVHCAIEVLYILILILLLFPIIIIRSLPGLLWSLLSPSERHIHKLLLHYLENKLIHWYRSGFCPNHCSQTAFMRLHESWSPVTNCSVFLEFKNAFKTIFDPVDHSILFKNKKLSLCIKDSSSLTFFQSCLISRTQYICFLLTTSHRQRD